MYCLRQATRETSRSEGEGVGGIGNWGWWRVRAVGDVTYARVFTLLH